MIRIDVARRLGDFSLEVEFTAESRGVTALFGQSGAGKTSVVNMMAGLLRPDRGRIAVDDLVLFDSERRIDLPPEKRRVGYVFQEDRLFPHLSVRANLTYGQKRAAEDGNRIDLDQVAKVFDIENLLDRRPRSLSGGEKQRVAIGRALLANPRLLLMDEPVASLDSRRKNEILPFIERLAEEFAIPIIYVSHSAEEIVRLADTLVLLSAGKIAAVGPVETLMSRLDLRPLTGRYEAGAVIAGRVTGHDAEFGLTDLSFPGGVLRVPLSHLAHGAELRVRIRARDVTLAHDAPVGLSTLNIFPGTIVEMDHGRTGGALVDVRLDIGVPLWARVTRRALHDLDLGIGDRVHALIKAVAIDHGSVGQRGQKPRDG
jgi:molybdate transport system ATP-binding protein